MIDKTTPMLPFNQFHLEIIKKLFSISNSLDIINAVNTVAEENPEDASLKYLIDIHLIPMLRDLQVHESQLRCIKNYSCDSNRETSEYLIRRNNECYIENMYPD